MSYLESRSGQNLPHSKMNKEKTGAPQVALVVKEPIYDAGDIREVDLIHGLGRSPGGGHGNPLQCSCLGNPHGQRHLACYSPKGCKESDMKKKVRHDCTD